MFYGPVGEGRVQVQCKWNLQYFKVQISVKLWVLAIKMKSPVLENSMLFTIEAAVLDRPGGSPHSRTEQQ